MLHFRWTVFVTTTIISFYMHKFVEFMGWTFVKHQLYLKIVQKIITMFYDFVWWFAKRRIILYIKRTQVQSQLYTHTRTTGVHYGVCIAEMYKKYEPYNYVSHFTIQNVYSFGEFLVQIFKHNFIQVLLDIFYCHVLVTENPNFYGTTFCFIQHILSHVWSHFIYFDVGQTKAHYVFNF